MTQSQQPVIDPELLSILACPETRESLRLASAEELAAANARIAQGGLENHGGERVTEALTAGLMRADGKRLYPIREGIPVLLVDEGIDL